MNDKCVIIITWLVCAVCRLVVCPIKLRGPMLDATLLSTASLRCRRGLACDVINHKRQYHMNYITWCKNDSVKCYWNISPPPIPLPLVHSYFPYLPQRCTAMPNGAWHAPLPPPFFHTLPIFHLLLLYATPSAINPNPSSIRLIPFRKASQPIILLALGFSDQQDLSMKRPVLNSG